jgi:hypothetical protein
LPKDVTFGLGERITVLLTADHEMPTASEKEPVKHAAKFIRFHAGNSEWADVELDEPHAGGTVKLAVPVSAISKTGAGRKKAQ